MSENQNDNRNQQAGSKSNQTATTQDGTQKKEINPNTPTANKNTEQGSEQNTPQQKNAVANPNKENTPANEPDKSKMDVDTTHGVKKTGEADAKPNDNKQANQNTVKPTM